MIKKFCNSDKTITVKSRLLAALVDKPQVYFVDVVKCVNEVYLQVTEMTHLALPTA